MTEDKQQESGRGISRRKLLIGAAVGGGLLVAWSFLPRQYAANVNATENEIVFDAYLKINTDGQIIVMVPQSEMGQGVYSVLPQILADELGADWRTIAVQPTAINPLYANKVIAKDWAANNVPARLLDLLKSDTVVETLVEDAERDAFMVTAGSSSARAFYEHYRDAGAIARVLLCKAAAVQWDVAWEDCQAKEGFVTNADKKLKFGELVEDASKFDVPDPLPRRPDFMNGVVGEDLPRLDMPSKVDGTASYAGDIRLPDMVYASIRRGPIGNTKLKSFNRQGAAKVLGLLDVVEHETWLAAVGTNWWAANRSLDLMAPIFETKGALAESESISEALDKALKTGDGVRFISRGASRTMFENHKLIEAEYQVAPALHASIETRTATAEYNGGTLQLWMASQSPNEARRAAAKAIGIGEDDVTLYPAQAGGSFGRNIDNEIAEQVAIIAKAMKRPVQLVWSRAEDLRQDHVRAPAHARLSAAVDTAGRVQALQTKIAVPPTSRELHARLVDGENSYEAMRSVYGEADILAVEGGNPPYAIDNFALDHHPAYVGIPTGRWRGNAHSYTAFFTESFFDELAENAKIEPLTFRMQMLTGQTRLARCLAGVAAMAKWDGGADGSGKGIACHSMRGSHVAIVATARKSEGGIKVDNISAMVDCGRIINQDIARQQIEGGILFGLSAAMGSSTAIEGGLTVAKRLRDMDFITLAESPRINVEFVENEEEMGGIGEIAVPPVAPAVANALFSATGVRFRQLPLISGGL